MKEVSGNMLPQNILGVRVFKSLVVLLMVFVWSNAFCQVDVTPYKEIADKFLADRFSSNLHGKYQFTSFHSKTPEEGYWMFDTLQLSRNTIDSFVSITFKYSFFSKQLNTELHFEITVNRDSTIDNSIDLSTYLPDCVLKDTPCNFLTKDQAIIIAKKSNILYSVDFEVEFVKPVDKKEYFWVIIGFNEKIDRTVEAQSGFQYSINQQRIVNAKTGEIVSHNDYWK